MALPPYAGPRLVRWTNVGCRAVRGLWCRVYVCHARLGSPLRRCGGSANLQPVAPPAGLPRGSLEGRSEESLPGGQARDALLQVAQRGGDPSKRGVSADSAAIRTDLGPSRYSRAIGSLDSSGRPDAGSTGIERTRWLLHTRAAFREASHFTDHA